MSGVVRTANRASGTYDAAILAMLPVAYWRVDTTGTDLTGNGHTATRVASPSATTFLNGDPASVFNGTSQYLEVADHAALSITATGRLTVEMWIRPDVSDFPDSEGSGPYVHFAGKKDTDQNEYACRMYNLTNDQGRPNRISGYCFNPGAGEGVGSYFEDVVTPGLWIHYAIVFNTVDVDGSFPTGYTKILKNGVERDKDSLSDLSIVPVNGTAPFRIGTATLDSYFKGAIAKVAIYNFELTAAQLLTHRQLIVG